jgi:hypothetical protein
MKDHSQTVFMVEGVQPTWLSSSRQRLVYEMLVALATGQVFWLPGGLLMGLTDSTMGLMSGLLSGSVIGLVSGVSLFATCRSAKPAMNGFLSLLSGGVLSGVMGWLFPGLVDWALLGVGAIVTGLLGGLGIRALNRITPVETMHWNWKNAFRGAITGSIIGLVSGISFEVLGSVPGPWPTIATIARTTIGPSLFGCLLNGLLGGLTDAIKVDKTYPNQGIRASLKNAVIGLLLTGFVVALFISLLSLLDGQWDVELFAVSAILGLIGGLNRGGSAVLKHYTLRWLFVIKGYTPFKFIQLLDHCARLIILQKVGGGYIFIHRTLLEYFAELKLQQQKGREVTAIHLPQ